MVPYCSNSFDKRSNTSCNYKCFGTTFQLLRHTKRAKMEHFFSRAIGYLIFQKDSENTKKIKRLKISLHSGCTAIFMNYRVIKILKLKKTNWSTKGGDSALVKNV
jgi:hypothetical protein